MKYQIHTFGCKVNTYDTGLMQRNLEKSGYVPDSQDPLVHVLNTCAVTAEATKEAVRTIRKLKAKSPFSKIVVTGCAAQVDTGAFENLPSVDLVIANSHKGLLPFLLDQQFKGELKEKVFRSNIFRKDDLEPGGGLEAQHTRAFLKIQDGCNSFCTYCIIPYARGKSRSVPILDLVRRVGELHSQGFQEVVLTGVHIGDYQDESLGDKGRLEDLIERLLLKTKVPRFRLTSLEPLELTDRLVDLYADPRLCRHFHMSIQSAQDDVLKAMKRTYLQTHVIQVLEKIQNRVPGSFVGMDVITGFPTETDDQFEDTFKVLSQTPWTRLHVFPYSERKGTMAATYTQLSNSIRKNRGARLRDLSLHRCGFEAQTQVGKIKWCLPLKETKKPQGLSRDYWTLTWSDQGRDLKSVMNEFGEIPVRVVSVPLVSAPGSEGTLFGEIKYE